MKEVKGKTLRGLEEVHSVGRQEEYYKRQMEEGKEVKEKMKEMNK